METSTEPSLVGYIVNKDGSRDSVFPTREDAERYQSKILGISLQENYLVWPLYDWSSVDEETIHQVFGPQ